MDAYSFHEMQKAGAFDQAPDDGPADILELLLDKFVETEYGRAVAASPPHRALILNFLNCSRDYLQNNPVMSQGMIDGGLALVLEDGETVRIVAPKQGKESDRPAPNYAVTQPRDSRMKGMRGGGESVIPVTSRKPPPR